MSTAISPSGGSDVEVSAVSSAACRANVQSPARYRQGGCAARSRRIGGVSMTEDCNGKRVTA
jgi:hypothetical protein